jgi:hypothetical protein
VYRIQRINVLSAAKIYALLIGGFMAFFGVFALIGAVITALMGEIGTAIGMAAFALIGPLVYAAMGFLIGALQIWIYNLVAGVVGGLEVELEAVGSPAETA